MDDFYVANPIGSFLYMQKYSRGRQSASFMMAHVAQEGLNQGPKSLCQGKGWPERGGNNVIFFKEKPGIFNIFSGKIGNIKIPFQQKDAKFHLRYNHRRTEDETLRRKEKKFNHIKWIQPWLSKIIMLV